MDIWSIMEREVKEYKEALAEDSSFHQDEADEELWLSLVRKLNQESFTLLKKSDNSPFKGMNGDGENATFHTIWDIVRRTPYLERLILVYKDRQLELPSELSDYERFGDFVRYVARGLKIPYST